jgi:hypothetical protein
MAVAALAGGCAAVISWGALLLAAARLALARRIGLAHATVAATAVLVLAGVVAVLLGAMAGAPGVAGGLLVAACAAPLALAAALGETVPRAIATWATFLMLGFLAALVLAGLLTAAVALIVR